MSSSVLRSTYRRMMKYFLRHWCMEIKCDGNKTTGRNTKRKDHDGRQESVEHDKQRNSINATRLCQMTLANLDKPADDDGIELDAQLEWEHEEGIERSPKVYRKSERDLLDILLTQSTHTTPSPMYTRAPHCPDFEWDHLFDFVL